MIVDREVFCPQCADAGRQTFLMQVIVTDHVVLRTICPRCKSRVIVTIKNASMFTSIETRAHRTVLTYTSVDN